MKKKIAVILGTRPEIIKLSPLIRLLEKKKRDFFIIHTGQHFSYEMDRLFFKELSLPEPAYRLNIRSKGVTLQADHTGRMLMKVEQILLKEMPSHVFVQGDTNTVLAGALTVSKLGTTKNYTKIHMRLCHVEAGLRSYDRSMPEEINRFITDHFSDHLFAPTRESARTLVREGVPKNRVFVTGNTIVDAVRQNVALLKHAPQAYQNLGLSKGEYFLLTLHRQENVDDAGRLESIFKGIAAVRKYFKKRIVFPIHPRTVKKLKTFRLKPPAGVELIAPVGFLDFLYFEANAGLILSDSGGVQEEACILRVPCVTLRHSTERPETVAVGANVVAGHASASILRAAQKMARVPRNWKNPFGDGRACERMLAITDRGTQ